MAQACIRWMASNNWFRAAMPFLMFLNALGVFICIPLRDLLDGMAPMEGCKCNDSAMTGFIAIVCIIGHPTSVQYGRKKNVSSKASYNATQMVAEIVIVWHAYSNWTNSYQWQSLSSGIPCTSICHRRTCCTAPASPSLTPSALASYQRMTP